MDFPSHPFDLISRRRTNGGSFRRSSIGSYIWRISEGCVGGVATLVGHAACIYDVDECVGSAQVGQKLVAE